MIDIKIKRLTNTAILPTKAHPSDACFDNIPYLEEFYNIAYKKGE